jgi:signal transduction histidine kinase
MIAQLRRAVRRRPLRLRLMLTYTGMFIVAGIMLVALTDALVSRNSATSASSHAAQQYYADVSPGCVKAFGHPSLVSSTTLAGCRQGLGIAASAIAERQRGSDRNSFYLYSGLALAIMAVVSAALGWIIAGRALRPVHAVTAAARRASGESLTDRISLTGPSDELKELADTFDAMLDRLDSAFSAQRRFVANASHELRTPLTLMQTSIDVTLAKADRTPAQLEQMAAEVKQAASRADAMIEALLTLARSDAGTTERESVDLAVVAEDALEAASSDIQARQLGVDRDLAEAPVVGDQVLIERMVANLVSNAARHNVPSGWLSVATGMRGGHAFVDVGNSGPRIPADLVAALFEPFRRLRERTGDATDGLGLGLSIARSVSDAHHGTMSAISRPDGGLDISVSLPPAGS